MPASQPLRPAALPLVGPSLHATRPHDQVADELRAIARAYSVRASVFVAEELDARARLRTIGYEIELRGCALPLMQAWYGGLTAIDMVRAALLRVAGHALAGPCPGLLCNPYSSRPDPVADTPVEVPLRIGLYHHDHALEGVDARAQPCVRTICERLSALTVWPSD